MVSVRCISDHFLLSIPNKCTNSDDYGSVAFAIDTKDARDAFGAILEKNRFVDEVWGSFHTVSNWAYAIYNDRPLSIRRVKTKVGLPRGLEDQTHTKLVPLSEALLEREIVRLATILTPGGDDRFSLKSMIEDKRTRVLGDTSRERVPIAWQSRFYMRIVNMFWYYQRNETMAGEPTRQPFRMQRKGPVYAPKSAECPQSRIVLLKFKKMQTGSIMRESQGYYINLNYYFYLYFDEVDGMSVLGNAKHFLCFQIFFYSYFTHILTWLMVQRPHHPLLNE